MKSALWWFLFRVLETALAKISDELTLHPPAIPSPILPPPLQLGPRAREAHRDLVAMAYSDPQRCLADQGGLFRGRMGGSA